MQNNTSFGKPGDRIGNAGERVLVEAVLNDGRVDGDGEVAIRKANGGLSYFPPTAVRPWTDRPEPPYVDPEFIRWCAYRNADKGAEHFIYVGNGEWVYELDTYAREDLPTRLVQVTAPLSTRDPEGDK